VDCLGVGAALPVRSGGWRVQVRRKGRYASEIFVHHDDASAWAVDAERKTDRGETPTSSRVGRLQTFGDLIGGHRSRARSTPAVLVGV